jgi:hypothetical protein
VVCLTLQPGKNGSETINRRAKLGARANQAKPGARTRGEVKNSLSYVKATSASFDQTNFSEALSSLKKGKPFSSSREMKRLKAAIDPVSF